MFTFLVILLVIIFIKLVLITGIHLSPSHTSMFELERRRATDDKEAMSELRKQQLTPDILSLQRVVTALLLVVFVLLSVVTFEWFFGIIISAVVALEYGAIARIGFLQRWGQKLYDKYEQQILQFVEKFSGVFRLVRSAVAEQAVPRLHSKQELEHLVLESGAVLSHDERKLITNSLKFDDKKVSEIMTPNSAIDSISKRELLGPLVLDDLHKTGHSRFPVIDGDINHVVGIIYIQDLLTVDAKRRSTTAEKAMEPRVFYINNDQSLQHALAAFLRTRHHLFVVVNEFRETVGLLSLEDVIEALLGRKIIDEFDSHEDLRMVALRNPRGNNDPTTHSDV